MSGLLPSSNLPALIPAPKQPTPEELREEFDRLSLALRQHTSKEKIPDDQTYKRTLQRSLDIITSMNQTTAGPKAAKKIGVEKKKPLSLDDL